MLNFHRKVCHPAQAEGESCRDLGRTGIYRQHRWLWWLAEDDLAGMAGEHRLAVIFIAWVRTRELEPMAKTGRPFLDTRPLRTDNKIYALL
jgi:hypothetical protein